MRWQMQVGDDDPVALAEADQQVTRTRIGSPFLFRHGSRYPL